MGRSSIKKVEVVADGTGLSSRAGTALLPLAAERLGLTDALGWALAETRERRSAHDPGRVFCDLAVMLADGGRCVSDLVALGSQPALFGDVASVSTARRVLLSVGEAELDRLRQARAQARARAWTAGAAPAEVILDFDATPITAHSDKEFAAGHYKGGFGFNPLLVSCGREVLATILRPGRRDAHARRLPQPPRAAQDRSGSAEHAAAVPWLVTWDDHEVDNNYAGTRSESLDPDFRRRRAAAYRAYLEHMPLRRRARPRESGMVLRSRRDWGRLARLHLLDGRQRRTPQACPPPGRGGAALIDERCRELHAPGRTMLGMPQEGWVTEGMRSAPERWNFIAQQTLMARARVMVDGRPRVSSDAWDGYPDARDRLLGAIADNGLRSCVVLSGDAHTAFVCDLKRTFDDAAAPVIAAEFCGTSITSPGRPQSRTDAIVRDNPHIRYGDSARRGYMVLDVTAERCTTRLRVINNPADRQTAVMTAATFVVDAGRPGAQPA